MSFNHDVHIFRAPEFQGIVNKAIEFFTQTPVHHLPPPQQFLGPGVYGLYYVGTYEPYEKISEANQISCVRPIYIGKAVAPGSRTARNLHSTSSDLYGRLKEHTEKYRGCPEFKD